MTKTQILSKNNEIWKTFHLVWISDGILSCLGSKKSRSNKVSQINLGYKKFYTWTIFEQLRNLDLGWCSDVWFPRIVLGSHISSDGARMYDFLGRCSDVWFPRMVVLKIRGKCLRNILTKIKHSRMKIFSDDINNREKCL